MTDISPAAANAVAAPDPFAGLHPLFREFVDPDSTRYGLGLPFTLGGPTNGIREDYVYATDGRVIVRARADALALGVADRFRDAEAGMAAKQFMAWRNARDEGRTPDGPRPVPKGWQMYARDASGPFAADPTPLPDLAPEAAWTPCAGPCGGTPGWVGKCEGCDGDGVQECDMGHEHRCPDCDGKGRATCPVCDGKGSEPDKAPVYLGGPIGAGEFRGERYALMTHFVARLRKCGVAAVYLPADMEAGGVAAHGEPGPARFVAIGPNGEEVEGRVMPMSLKAIRHEREMNR